MEGGAIFSYTFLINWKRHGSCLLHNWVVLNDMQVAINMQKVYNELQYLILTFQVYRSQQFEF